VLAFLLMIAFKFKQNILNPDYSCFWHGLRQAKKKYACLRALSNFSISNDFLYHFPISGNGTFNGQTVPQLLFSPPHHQTARFACFVEPLVSLACCVLCSGVRHGNFEHVCGAGGR
jgi:hypothetical protein